MSKFLTKYIFISFVFWAGFASAQDEPVETETLEKKKEKSGPVIDIDGIRAGIDIFGLGQTFLSQERDVLEFQGDVRLKSYFFAVSYGTASLDDSNVERGILYENSGSYFRAGIDYNFLNKDPDGSAFFFGIRYARGSVEDRLRFDFSGDPNWADTPGLDRQNDRLSTRWLEFTSGLKVKVYKLIWFGYNLRFNFALNIEESNTLLPFFVPGYGLAQEGSRWGFNYYVLFDIPFKKKADKPAGLKN
ncbi:MAG: DUF6048 family protein [Bacteroidota bacterium]